jgi:hypothetical protein
VRVLTRFPKKKEEVFNLVLGFSLTEKQNKTTGDAW